MASVIKLSKGLDMNLKGKAAKEKATFVRGSELALTPDAFVGMTPKVVVKEGDMVKAGDLLLLSVDLALPICSCLTGLVFHIQHVISSPS